jgi:chromosome segregation ATPase
MRTIKEYFRIKLHWFRIYTRAIKNLWKLGSMDKGLKDYYKYKHIVNNRLDELEKRANLLTSCIDNNFDKLEDKMHNLERNVSNNKTFQSASINDLDRCFIKLEKRIDNNYDKLEDKIEEEGKLFDSLEAMQGVNKNSIETLARGLMDIKDKIIKIESCEEISTQLIESLLNKVETLESNHINLSNKGGK